MAVEGDNLVAQSTLLLLIVLALGQWKEAISARRSAQAWGSSPVAPLGPLCALLLPIMTRCLEAHRMQGQEPRLPQVQIRAATKSWPRVRHCLSEPWFLLCAMKEQGPAFRGLECG